MAHVSRHTRACILCRTQIDAEARKCPHCWGLQKAWMNVEANAWSSLAFFVLLGWVGATILPVLHGDSLVSLPWVPMSVVQSVIPITSALIVVAEVTHLLDLVAMREPPAPAPAGPAIADGLH